MILKYSFFLFCLTYKNVTKTNNAMANVKIEQVHISQISIGDTIKHDGHIRTVSANNIKRNTFCGTTLFGDSYNLGTKAVNKVIKFL